MSAKTGTWEKGDRVHVAAPNPYTAVLMHDLDPTETDEDSLAVVRCDRDGELHATPVADLSWPVS